MLQPRAHFFGIWKAERGPLKSSASRKTVSCSTDQLTLSFIILPLWRCTLVPLRRERSAACWLQWLTTRFFMSLSFHSPPY